jgi:uncharacterized membrane protein YidH (DUF202 family)
MKKVSEYKKRRFKRVAVAVLLILLGFWIAIYTGIASLDTKSMLDKNPSASHSNLWTLLVIMVFGLGICAPGLKLLTWSKPVGPEQEPESRS